MKYWDNILLLDARTCAIICILCSFIIIITRNVIYFFWNDSRREPFFKFSMRHRILLKLLSVLAYTTAHPRMVVSKENLSYFSNLFFLNFCSSNSSNYVITIISVVWITRSRQIRISSHTYIYICIKYWIRTAYAHTL